MFYTLGVPAWFKFKASQESDVRQQVASLALLIKFSNTDYNLEPFHIAKSPKLNKKYLYAMKKTEHIDGKTDLQATNDLFSMQLSSTN